MQHDPSALILIDLQNDFFPGGALGVPGADAIFPHANDLQHYFNHIIATQDWHPHRHKSFASSHAGKKIFEVINLNGHEQVLWPDHCVQHSTGAALHPALDTRRIEKIIYKGSDLDIDSYSGFFDNAHQKNTGLDAYLKQQNIQHLFITGLATDYCVLYTVLDAIDLGYAVTVIQDACFGINKTPGDIDKALTAMQNKGAKIIMSSVLKQERRKLF